MKLPPRNLNLNPLTPPLLTPYKYLNLWSDHHVKGEWYFVNLKERLVILFMIFYFHNYHWHLESFLVWRSARTVKVFSPFCIDGIPHLIPSSLGVKKSLPL